MRRVSTTLPRLAGCEYEDKGCERKILEEWGFEFGTPENPRAAEVPVTLPEGWRLERRPNEDSGEYQPGTRLLIVDPQGAIRVTVGIGYGQARRVAKVAGQRYGVRWNEAKKHYATFDYGSDAEVAGHPDEATARKVARMLNDTLGWRGTP